MQYKDEDFYTDKCYTILVKCYIIHTYKHRVMIPHLYIEQEKAMWVVASFHLDFFVTFCIKTKSKEIQLALDILILKVCGKT